MPHVPDLSGSALDDRYELHAVIGEGAFGRVYEGRDRRLERPVAVKVIKPWWGEDPEWVADLRARDTAAGADLGPRDRPDLRRRIRPRGPYYVSELVSGENLAQRLARGPIAPWRAADIAAQLCRALAGAHAQRIVHRDVKPPNILLSSAGQVKVGDFGVAGLAEGSSGGGSHTIVGTPAYMAPEQSRGRPVSPATDVYSAGVVLYEMVAGARPFSADSPVDLALCHLQDPPPELPANVPSRCGRSSRGRWPRTRRSATPTAARWPTRWSTRAACLRARRERAGGSGSGPGARAVARAARAAASGRSAARGRPCWRPPWPRPRRVRPPPCRPPPRRPLFAGPTASRAAARPRRARPRDRDPHGACAPIRPSTSRVRDAAAPVRAAGDGDRAR